MILCILSALPFPVLLKFLSPLESVVVSVPPDSHFNFSCFESKSLYISPPPEGAVPSWCQVGYINCQQLEKEHQLQRLGCSGGRCDFSLYFNSAHSGMLVSCDGDEQDTQLVSDPGSLHFCLICYHF